MIVTHRLGEVWDLATRIAVLADGRVGLRRAARRARSTRFSRATTDWSVPEALRLALAIAGKDIRAELRSRTALLSAVVFAALVLVVFNFARDPTALAAVDLAPSVLWVTFALAAMVALNRAFTIERENGALDGLLLAPVPRGAVFLGKLLANLAFVGTVEAVTLAAVRALLQRGPGPRPAGHPGRDGARHDRVRGGRDRSSAPWRSGPGSPS